MANTIRDIPLSRQDAISNAAMTNTSDIYTEHTIKESNPPDDEHVSDPIQINYDNDDTKKYGPEQPSLLKGAFMVIAAVCITLCTSGLIFGYAALKPVLIHEGAFSDLCIGEIGPDGCTEQILMLNSMFFIASVVLSFSALTGIVGDYIGPRLLSVSGSVFMTTGLLLMAFSTDDFPAYIPGYCFLALGGQTIMLGLLHLVNLFPKYFGLINGALNGAFDSSTLIFLIFQTISNTTGVQLKVIWLAYIVVPVLSLVFSVTMLGSKAYQSNFDTSSVTSLNVNSEIKKKRKGAPKMHSLKHLSFKKHVFSIEFIMNTLFLLINMLRFNLYIATVSEQLHGLLGNDQSIHSKLMLSFDIILPLVGIATIPLVGYFLDNLGSIATVWIIIVLHTVAGILQLIPVGWLQIPQMIIFVTCRACLYAFNADYIGRMFGFVTFGRLIGISLCLSGVSNIVSYFLNQLVDNQLNGDFQSLNISLTVLYMITVIHPLIMRRRNIAYLATKSATQSETTERFNETE